jgi:hypothetical protein
VRLFLAAARFCVAAMRAKSAARDPAAARVCTRAVRALRLVFFASVFFRLCALVPTLVTVCVVALRGRGKGRGLGLGRLDCVLACVGYADLVRLYLGSWPFVLGSVHGISPRHL